MVNYSSNYSQAYYPANVRSSTLTLGSTDHAGQKNYKKSVVIESYF